MTSPVHPLECGVICQAEADFSLKFVVTALELTDEDEDNGFEDVLVTISFDGSVIKISDFEEKEDSENDGEIEAVGRGLDLRLTPEQFCEKLRICPIMLNLSRGCNDLGTVKLDLGECFMDAPKCEEFEKQNCSMDLKFIEDGEENGKMTLIFQVSRKVDSKLFKGLRKPKKIEKKKSIEEISVGTNLSSNSSDMEVTRSDRVRKAIEIHSDIESCRPTSSTKSKTKSIRSKCDSDIATSLDLHNYSEFQHTFCDECGKFSISGVTCKNKKAHDNIEKPASEPVTKIVKIPTICDPCKVPKPRYCPDCFENLTEIQGDAPCPNCITRKKCERQLTSFKSEKTKRKENEQIRSCIRSIVEEIFLDTKDRLMRDWQRLNKSSQAKKKKVGKTVKIYGASTRESLKPNPKKPRCTKVRQALIKLQKTPGIVLGHECCQTGGFLVPKNMGWLWNVGTHGMPCMRRGWRPGAVKKSVAKIMKKFLAPPAEPAPIPKDPPTLSVKKKQGEYLIVMNPMGVDGELTGSPIVFKIQKSGEEIKRAKARKILKARGVVRTCNCCSIETCKCLNDCEKSRIKTELEKVSQELCLQCKLTINDLKDTSESEIDMEFTPPSAMKSKNPCRKKLTKFSYAETQYEAQSMSESEIDFCATKIRFKQDGRSLKSKESTTSKVQRTKLKRKNSLKKIPSKVSLKPTESSKSIRWKTTTKKPSKPLQEKILYKTLTAKNSSKNLRVNFKETSMDRLKGKTLEIKESFKKLQEKTGKAIKERKVESRKRKIRFATNETTEKGGKIEKSKSKQQLQRKQKTSDFSPSYCNFYVPECKSLECLQTPAHRYTSCRPLNAQCRSKPQACAQYEPIYY